MDDRMQSSYRAAKRLLDFETSVEDQDLLGRIEKSDVLVVKGCYDRVEDVLRIMEIPHEVIDPQMVGALPLRPEQMLIVNCPGHVDVKGIMAIRSFVENGGSLFTTDWALKHVLEPAFPGFVEYNQRATADDVVRVEVKDSTSRFLDGVFHEGADPLWWLEGSSYPIRVLDRERVNILLTSGELEQKYGEAPVAVSFTAGKGDVFHMISHYYLQRAETRTERHKGKWSNYAGELGLENVSCLMKGYEDLSTGEVEAAHKSAKFVRNLILDKQRRNREK